MKNIYYFSTIFGNLLTWKYLLLGDFLIKTIRSCYSLTVGSKDRQEEVVFFKSLPFPPFVIVGQISNFMIHIIFKIQNCPIVDLERRHPS